MVHDTQLSAAYRAIRSCSYRSYASGQSTSSAILRKCSNLFARSSISFVTGSSADKPNPPNAADKSANEGNWQIEEGKSPTDGSPLIVAANLVADTVLILRCKDQTTEVAFSTKYNYLGSRSVDVTLRINDEKPFKEVWKASIDGRAAFASNAVEFIRMLPDDGKLFIKTSRSDGRTKEANFTLGKVSDIRSKIARACDWDDAPEDKPVGSGDHSEHR